MLKTSKKYDQHFQNYNEPAFSEKREKFKQINFLTLKKENPNGY